MSQKQPQLNWRPMKETDILHVERIGKIVHSTVPEDIEVFKNRLELCPDGSFILEKNGVPTGYAVVHPWVMNDAPELNQLVDRLPNPETDQNTCLFFHDFALLPQARGHGAPVKLIKELFQKAKANGFKAIGLVSIHGSRTYWSRYGFEEVHVQPGSELDRVLKSYCDDAVYMHTISSAVISLSSAMMGWMENPPSLPYKLALAIYTAEGKKMQ